jgi:hypothetical protein
MERTAQSWIPLAAAAVRCGLSWPRAYNAVLSGRLEGHQDERGRWLCSPASVERYAREIAETIRVRQHHGSTEPQPAA